MKSLGKLKKIKGDASSREFYRLQKKNKTSIIVKAKKEKFKNLAVYAVVNDILNRNKINAPKLLSDNYRNNEIEISDLGERSFYDHVILKKNKFNDYKAVMKLLINIQKIKIKKSYKFQNLKIRIPKYTLSYLHKESDLFFDWYLKYILKKKKISKIRKELRLELNRVYKKLSFKNDIFVHRDFHISNIMFNKKKLGLIDSQDALIGNPLYDLASLIDDVRIRLPNKLQNDLFYFYYKNSILKKDKIENLKNDFDILSVQRNLKILGIFVRLFKRDKKPTYLKYLPYTWILIERRLKNPILKNFHYLLKKHLKIKKIKKIKNL